MKTEIDKKRVCKYCSQEVILLGSTWVHKNTRITLCNDKRAEPEPIKCNSIIKLNSRILNRDVRIMHCGLRLNHKGNHKGIEPDFIFEW